MIRALLAVEIGGILYYEIENEMVNIPAYIKHL